MRHVAGGRAHELRDDRARAAGEQDLGVADHGYMGPPVSCSTSCRTDPTAPQNSPERIAATVAVPRAGGGSASSAMSICGRRSVNSCSARADMAMPGRIAPPRKAPSASTRSTVMAEPTSTTTAGRPGVRRRLAARASSKPIDADHVGPRQLDDQRQIARGQQHDFIVRAMIAEPVDQPRRRRAVDAADVPAEMAWIRVTLAIRRRVHAARRETACEPGVELIELRQSASEMQRGLRLGQAGGNGLPKQAELDSRVANVNGDEGGLETDDHFSRNHGLRFN